MSQPRDEDVCPETGERDCWFCSGQACLLCGAGLMSSFNRPPCEHDVVERHERAPLASGGSLP